MPHLGRQVWSEIQQGSTLLIPLGATEQHGPHLPFDTDARIATTLAERAAAATGATVAPVLPYGSSGEHVGFPGTLSIGAEALRHVVIELVRSARLTYRRIVLVNGHGGNHGVVTGAAEQMRSEGHDVVVWWPSVPGGDAHAGRTETSLMLAIAPETVRLERAEAGNVEPLADLMPTLRSDGVDAVSPNGVLGDPTDASATEGDELLTELTGQLVRTISGSGPK